MVLMVDLDVEVSGFVSHGLSFIKFMVLLMLGRLMLV